jgi:hypothetical protein
MDVQARDIQSRDIPLHGRRSGQCPGTLSCQLFSCLTRGLFHSLRKKKNGLLLVNQNLHMLYTIRQYK